MLFVINKEMPNSRKNISKPFSITGNLKSDAKVRKKMIYIIKNLGQRLKIMLKYSGIVKKMPVFLDINL